MKSQREIFQALAEGKVLKNTFDMIVKLNDDGFLISTPSHTIQWETTEYCFNTPEEWSIYEPPKEKKKYWQWKIKDCNEWARLNSYYDDTGRKTNGGKYGGGWDNLEKIKIEDDFIEV